jgi:adenylate kinase family enzyme
MNKLAIVINGGGGAGKDTLCDMAAKHFDVVNVSSIDPIKRIARENGWNGEKGFGLFDRVNCEITQPEIIEGIMRAITSEGDYEIPAPAV